MDRCEKALSFSNDVKNEICSVYKMPESCKAAMLYGLFSTAKTFNENEIELVSESKTVAEYILNQIEKLYRFKLEPVKEIQIDFHKKPLYQIHITSRVMCKTIYDSFDCGKFSEYISLLSLDQSITWTFIKGAFLGSGSVSNPDVEYHLEFIFKGKEKALLTQNMLSTLSLNSKLMLRRQNFVVYCKDSSIIEDILAGIGSVKMALSLMDSKVIKDLRNRLNRQNNCETANMKRTIDVATKQVEAIEYILSKCGIESLSDDMQKIALFRLENPEMSLGEMAIMLNGEFSKSGIDRRLKKLVQTYDDIKEKKGE